MQSKVDKIYIGESETSLYDLSKISNVVKKDVKKVNMMNWLRVNSIQNTDTSDLDKKLTTTQKSMKSKRKLMMMIFVNRYYSIIC